MHEALPLSTSKACHSVEVSVHKALPSHCRQGKRPLGGNNAQGIVVAMPIKPDLETTAGESSQDKACKLATEKFSVFAAFPAFHTSVQTAYW